MPVFASRSVSTARHFRRAELDGFPLQFLSCLIFIVHLVNVCWPLTEPLSQAATVVVLRNISWHIIFLI